jgi:hypothetical protein
MNREQFDIFICGGSQHVQLLLPMLAKLRPYGRVHLASSFFNDDDLQQLGGRYDVLVKPRHTDDGYCNFELFCIRDINRLAVAPYFIKLDADVQLQPDWIRYVEDCIATHPGVVLFGPRQGNNKINFTLSGKLVRQLLGAEVKISNGLKVGGGFYVGRTPFFKEHQRLMEVIHELMWCYRNGVRVRPPIYPEYWSSVTDENEEPIALQGHSENFQGNEDMLRSLVVHAAGAGDRLKVINSQGRVHVIRTNILNPDSLTHLPNDAQTRQTV